VHPTLAVVLVGEDAASRIYVKRKLQASSDAGIASREYRLDQGVSEGALLQLIDELNVDHSVHGILVQLPLPEHIDAKFVLDRIDPRKDVDGFHPVNVGRLSIGHDALVPCTPLGCMRLLDTVIDDYRGLKAVVIGKSNIVGKPVAILLRQAGRDPLLERECTVTVTHILTRDFPQIVRTADIVAVAAGSPGLVRDDWVKPGAVVIDVGINRVTGEGGKSRMVGDVVTAEMDHARAVTPVPGGVGPMTVACLLANTSLPRSRCAMSIEREQAGCRLIDVRVSDLRLAARIGADVHEMDRRQTLHIAATLSLVSVPADRLAARIRAPADRLDQVRAMLQQLKAGSCLGYSCDRDAASWPLPRINRLDRAEWQCIVQCCDMHHLGRR